MTRGKRIAIIAGIGVAVVVGLVCMEWEQVRFWWMFASIGKNEQGYPEYRHRQSGIIMVSLPGGTFTMGSPKSEPDYDHVPHEVTLSSFLIAKFGAPGKVWERGKSCRAT